MVRDNMLELYRHHQPIYPGPALVRPHPQQMPAILVDRNLHPRAYFLSPSHYETEPNRVNLKDTDTEVARASPMASSRHRLDTVGENVSRNDEWTSAPSAKTPWNPTENRLQHNLALRRLLGRDYRSQLLKP